MRRSLFFPLPLWERVAARQRGRVRGNVTHCGYPSSVADFVRATFSHKGRRKEENYTRSMIVAVPMPPPMHRVTSAVDLPVRSSSSSTVPRIIAPVAPSG